jgi:hypothetical protein
MKVAFGLILMVGVGLFALYYWGGYGTLDPTQQGRDARAAITPSMTVKQVFDAIGPPRRFSVVNLKKVERFGQEVEELVPAPRADFDLKRFETNRASGEYPYGFQFEYRHSPTSLFQVTFDGAGLVTDVGDVPTVGALLAP